jgi:hypothetical protein
MVTPEDEPDVHPDALVTANVKVPAGSPVTE